MENKQIQESKLSVLFKKHKKHLPERLKGTFIGEFCRYGFMIFLSAWILQGVRITNWREVVIKYGIDIILIAIFITLGLHWALAFVIAHTLNFMFDGQFFAMFTHMGATGVTAQKFLDKTVELAESAKTKTFCNAAIAYGSLSRGCFKRTSDIDLRLIPASGELNWWKTAFWALWLRMKAFVDGYPLDMYCYDPQVVIKKMRTDELPIMVNEKDKCMMKWYPERVEFDEFIKIFTDANIK